MPDTTDWDILFDLRSYPQPDTVTPIPADSIPQAHKIATEWLIGTELITWSGVVARTSLVPYTKPRMTVFAITVPSQSASCIVLPSLETVNASKPGQPLRPLPIFVTPPCVNGGCKEDDSTAYCYSHHQKQQTPHHPSYH